METIEIITLIKEVGAPIAVCAFLAVLLKGDLKELVKSVSEQSKSIVELVTLIRNDRDDIKAITQSKISMIDTINRIEHKSDKIQESINFIAMKCPK